VNTKAITLLKEDVLSLGRMVDRTVEEMARLLQKSNQASLSFVEGQEVEINQHYQEIEEKCLDLLLEKDLLDARQIRTVFCSTIIAAKLERMADHANRVARLATWAAEEKIEIPKELADMAAVVHRMVQDVLLGFVEDSPDKALEVMKRDSEVDFLHDFLSKKLLSDLGEQEAARAQMRAQFLFCARFIERMGDACTSIAKRIYFIATGERLKPGATRVNS